MSLRLSSARRREKAAREAERRELIASLASTRTLIQQAYGGLQHRQRQRSDRVLRL